MFILTNGNFYHKENGFEAMAIDEGIIKAVGSNEEIKAMAGSDDEIMDLQGKFVLPGFIDSHAHGAMSVSLVLGKIDMREGRSAEEYVEIVAAFIEENPEMELYLGAGWSSAVFPDKGPSKELLDEICPDKPIILKAIEGHSLWVNSAALEFAEVTAETPVPPGGVIELNEDGSIYGTIKEDAQFLFERMLPEPGIEDYMEAILMYQTLMTQYGITAATEMKMDKDSNMHLAYKALAAENQLLIKAGLSYMVTPEETEEQLSVMKDREYICGNKLIDGDFAKFFIDGVLEGGTAWLKEPYCNIPEHYGESLWTDDALFDACLKAYEMGYNLHFHVIGDAAVSQMISAVEYVQANTQIRPGSKFVAAHVQLATPDDIKRMKAAGFCVSANPYWFFKEEGYYDEIAVPMLGERAEKQYPMKSLMDAGIVVSASSDFAATDNPDPLVAVKIGVERVGLDCDPADESQILNPDERVSLEEMIDAVTAAGAYTMNIEEQTGSLDVGKFADLVVLSDNLFETDPARWHEIEVEMTVSEGQIVYAKDTEE